MGAGLCIRLHLILYAFNSQDRRFTMKLTLACFAAVVFILGFGFTANAIHETVPSETQIVMPGPDAEKLNQYINRYDPYTAWGMWPGKGKLYKGTEPHGALLTTFINDRASRSLN